MSKNGIVSPFAMNKWDVCILLLIEVKPLLEISVKFYNNQLGKNMISLFTVNSYE